MMKFGEYLSENLAAEVKTEPKSAAAKEARRLGLTYMGFGRYANSKGQVAYIVDNDRLIPFKGREEVQSMYSKSAVPSQGFATFGAPKKEDKTKKKSDEVSFYASSLNKREKEDVKIAKQKNKEALALNKDLYNYYNANIFDQNELSAIGFYTSDGYENINRYLYKGADVDMSDDEIGQLEDFITNLDSAFESTEAPYNFSVYTGLSSRYDPDKFKVGEEYLFRGYISASLDHNVAISQFSTDSFGDLSEKPIVLQIEISKGQRAIYTDAISTNPGEMETLLPRGSKIKVMSGPHIMDASTVSTGKGSVYLFHCQLVEDL